MFQVKHFDRCLLWKYTLVPIWLLRSWCTQTVGMQWSLKVLQGPADPRHASHLEPSVSKTPNLWRINKNPECRVKKMWRPSEADRLQSKTPVLVFKCLAAWLMPENMAPRDKFFILCLLSSSYFITRAVKACPFQWTPKAGSKKAFAEELSVWILSLTCTEPEILVQARSKTQKWDASWLMSKIVSSSCTVQDI